MKREDIVRKNRLEKNDEAKPARNLLLLEFSVLSFVAFAVIGYTVLSAVRPALEGFILRKEEAGTVVAINSQAGQLLTAQDFQLPLTAIQAARLDAFIKNTNISGLIQFFVVDSSGLIIYARPAEYIGRTFAENADFKFALERRQATARFQKVTPKEQQELGVGEAFIQVVPITFGTSGEVSGVAYIVARVGLLRKQIEDTQAAMAVRIIGGLLFLYSVLFVIVWRASRTIRRQAGELASYTRNLEQRVRERTFDLEQSTQRQIAQAKELARLKDEFVFIAAHELKAPITHLRWSMAEFFASKDVQEKVPPEIHDLMSVIKKASDSLAKLVSDLLNVARLESGTVKVLVHPTDLVAIVQDVALQFKPEAEKQDIAISFEYDQSKKMPFAMSDSERLKEVFSNLLSNAIKYNKAHGSVEVNVRQEADFLEASVKDTGVGISEEDVEHLFGKFWRAPEHRNIEGTGLGLWITKQLIERMGGKIWAESKKGEGSTFFIRLPIASEKKIKEVPAE